MKTLNGLRRRLGTKGALQYLRDYHQSRVNPDGDWDSEADKVHSYSRDHDISCADREAEICQHAMFMDQCGTDLDKYAHLNSRRT